MITNAQTFDALEKAGKKYSNLITRIDAFYRDYRRTTDIFEGFTYRENRARVEKARALYLKVDEEYDQRLYENWDNGVFI